MSRADWLVVKGAHCLPVAAKADKDTGKTFYGDTRTRMVG